MAGYLAKNGHQTKVYNRTAAKAEKWVAEHGGASAKTPAEAAAGCDMVFACVGNDDDLRSVMLGDDGILAGCKDGAIVVDHTTASAIVAPRAGRNRRRPRPAVSRRAGVRRPGGGRKRRADGDGRRRAGGFR